VDRPFHWSGHNSERERRAAGKALLARLTELEQTGHSYHLIGHSHGGSVIWNALVGSARLGLKLNGLKTWITVGTPHLTFAALRPSLWRWLALAILLVFDAKLFTLGAPGESWSALKDLWRNGAYTQLSSVGVFYIGMLLLTAWAIWRIVRPGALLVAELRERRAERTTADWYGVRWLSLLHPLDEPL